MPPRIGPFHLCYCHQEPDHSTSDTVTQDRTTPPLLLSVTHGRVIPPLLPVTLGRTIPSLLLPRRVGPFHLCYCHPGSDHFTSATATKGRTIPPLPLLVSPKVGSFHLYCHQGSDHSISTAATKDRIIPSLLLLPKVGPFHLCHHHCSQGSDNSTLPPLLSPRVGPFHLYCHQGSDHSTTATTCVTKGRIVTPLSVSPRVGPFHNCHY